MKFHHLVPLFQTPTRSQLLRFQNFPNAQHTVEYLNIHNLVFTSIHFSVNASGRRRIPKSKKSMVKNMKNSHKNAQNIRPYIVHAALENSITTDFIMF